MNYLGRLRDDARRAPQGPRASVPESGRVCPATHGAPAIVALAAAAADRRGSPPDVQGLSQPMRVNAYSDRMRKTDRLCCCAFAAAWQGQWSRRICVHVMPNHASSLYQVRRSSRWRVDLSCIFKGRRTRTFRRRSRHLRAGYRIGPPLGCRQCCCHSSPAR